MGVRVSNLQVVYKNGNVIAVDNISFTVDNGVVLGILGPNGAGKTSLLKAIAKLVKYKGLVYIDGLEISRTPMRAISKLLSYAGDIDVPEYLSLKVLEAILLARSPVSRRFIESREDLVYALKLVQELGLSNLIDRRLNELSSGELRRAVIAMALAKNPRYILLDEPDSHLDLKNKVLVSKLIKRIALDKAKTIIFTSHDILFTINTASHVLLVKDGKPVMYGSVGDVLDESVLEKVYGVKFTLVNYGEGRETIPIPLYS